MAMEKELEVEEELEVVGCKKNVEKNDANINKKLLQTRKNNPTSQNLPPNPNAPNASTDATPSTPYTAAPVPSTNYLLSPKT